MNLKLQQGIQVIHCRMFQCAKSIPVWVCLIYCKLCFLSRTLITIHVISKFSSHKYTLNADSGRLCFVNESLWVKIKSCEIKVICSILHIKGTET